MKNIILQHFDGKLRELDKLSIENIKEYAKLIGVEYELVLGKPFNDKLTAPCQKVSMINECWDEYDNVLMLDIDMFAPIGMTENVFDVNGVGLHGPVQQMLHRKIIRQNPKFASKKSPYWGGAIYKMDRELRQRLRIGLFGADAWIENYNVPYQFEDEGIFHTLAYKTGLRIDTNSYMDNKWCQCSFLPEPEKAGFIHVRTKVKPSGPKRKKIENYNSLVDKGIL